MCHHCIQHGGGGKWFLAAQNFAATLYRRRRKEAQKKAAKAEKKVGEVVGPHQKPPEYYMTEDGEFALSPGAQVDLDIMFSDLMREVLEATGKDVRKLPILKKKVNSFMANYHFGQVVTLEEAEEMVEITYPIGIMECICRRESRGMYNNDNAMTCLSLGVGIYKWERWPETFRGMTFLSVKEAKERLRHFDRRGNVHTLWTFYTPYIGGICNCEYPTCLGIRGRVDYDVNEILLKGEYCAMPIEERCIGCGECITFCQFGAMSLQVSRNKVNINMKKCFGCAQCAHHCRHEAIKMVERMTTPGLRDLW
ncbi:MAG: 4Fe-4S dicluster domain-containing protein [Candidatus Schekmanbacteria bacterium]|nr:MAG: 4Fe-4S dicluster domain-containing protein [Candidatus Schekmanbacteria bacterium]